MPVDHHRLGRVRRLGVGRRFVRRRSIGLQEIIYEMRFDEVVRCTLILARFYLGVRVRSSDLGRVLEGELP